MKCVLLNVDVFRLVLALLDRDPLLQREHADTHTVPLGARGPLGVATVHVKAADGAVTESPALVFINTVQTGISSSARLQPQRSLLWKLAARDGASSVTAWSFCT